MPYLTYTDNSGIEHESYEAACYYYGADTPAQIEAEERAEYEEWLADAQINEALIFPLPTPITDDEIPF